MKKVHIFSFTGSANKHESYYFTDRLLPSVRHSINFQLRCRLHGSFCGPRTSLLVNLRDHYLKDSK
jgi:hypothetical protein